MLFDILGTVDDGREVATTADFEGDAVIGASTDVVLIGTLYGEVPAETTAAFAGALVFGPRSIPGDDRSAEDFVGAAGENADGARGGASDGSASPAVARGRLEGAGSRPSALAETDNADECAGAIMEGTPFWAASLTVMLSIASRKASALICPGASADGNAAARAAASLADRSQARKARASRSAAQEI